MIEVTVITESGASLHDIAKVSAIANRVDLYASRRAPIEASVRAALRMMRLHGAKAIELGEAVILAGYHMDDSDSLRAKYFTTK